jgi:hypothetical protein
MVIILYNGNFHGIHWFHSQETCEFTIIVIARWNLLVSFAKKWEYHGYLTGQKGGSMEYFCWDGTGQLHILYDIKLK